MTPTTDHATLKAEAAKLAAARGYSADQITAINLSDGGELASIALGTDADGMGRFILAFSL